LICKNVNNKLIKQLNNEFLLLLRKFPSYTKI
jgi:hypothetical protein